MPVTKPYIPSRKFLAIGAAAGEKINLSDYLTDLEVVEEIDPKPFATYDGTNFDRIEAGIKRWRINATWVASTATRGVRQTLGGLVGRLAYFEASPGADKPSPDTPIIRGRCFVDSLPYVPAGAKREIGTITTSWVTSGVVQVATPRLWWRRWHGLTAEPTAFATVQALAASQEAAARGSATSLDLVPELGLEGPPRSLTLRVTRGVVKPGRTVNQIRYRAGNDGIDERIYGGVFAAGADGPDLSTPAVATFSHDPTQGTNLGYIHWRRFERLGSSGRPTSLADAMSGVNNLADNFGWGTSGGSAADIGLADINYTLTIRAVRFVVKPGNTVDTIAYRTDSSGVDAAMWCGLYPDNGSGIPDVTATPVGLAQRTTPLTSRWTSTQVPITAGQRPAAGETWYAVSAHWQETASPRGRFSLNFNGRGWNTQFNTSPGAVPVTYQRWAWYERGPGYETADYPISPAFAAGATFYVGVGHYRATNPSRGRVHISFDGGTEWVTDLLDDYTAVEFPRWAWV